jgi:hypothetical protein
LRVLYAVECQDEACCLGLVRRFEQVFDCEIFLRADQGNDTLMSSGPGELGELLPRFLANADPCLAAIGDKARESVVVALAGHEHVVKTAPSGFEGFLDRVQAVENFHKE